MPQLEIMDVRQRVLDFEAGGEKQLRGFLQFENPSRRFSDPSALQDCFFTDVYLSYYTKNWPGGLGPPHPGLFGEFFTLIADRLVGSDTLTLFVKSCDPAYFSEFDFISRYLAPRRIPYMLLPSKSDPKYGINVGNLVFEWSTAALGYIRENWFMSPQVRIEGYISRGQCLPSLTRAYFADDTEQTVREFLREIEIGVSVWPDNNGLFLVSDKFATGAVDDRLRPEELAELIREAAKEHDERTSSPREPLRPL